MTEPMGHHSDATSYYLEQARIALQKASDAHHARERGTPPKPDAEDVESDPVTTPTEDKTP